MSKPIKGWITRDRTPTSTPYTQLDVLHVRFKLQSVPKVNRMTLVYWKRSYVKTDMGWFLTTDRPQISVRKYYGGANWGWPSHKHSTDLFLLSGIESILSHWYMPSQARFSPSPLLPICALCYGERWWQMVMERNWYNHWRLEGVSEEMFLISM